MWNLLGSFLKHEDQLTLQRAVMQERPALEPGDRWFRNIPNVKRFHTGSIMLQSDPGKRIFGKNFRKGRRPAWLSWTVAFLAAVCQVQAQRGFSLPLKKQAGSPSSMSDWKPILRLFPGYRRR